GDVIRRIFGSETPVGRNATKLARAIVRDGRRKSSPPHRSKVFSPDDLRPADPSLIVPDPGTAPMRLSPPAKWDLRSTSAGIDAYMRVEANCMVLLAGSVISSNYAALPIRYRAARSKALRGNCARINQRSLQLTKDIRVASMVAAASIVFGERLEGAPWVSSG